MPHYGPVTGRNVVCETAGGEENALEGRDRIEEAGHGCGKVRVAHGLQSGSLDGYAEGLRVEVHGVVEDDAEVCEAEVRYQGDQFVLTNKLG